MSMSMTINLTKYDPTESYFLFFTVKKCWKNVFKEGNISSIMGEVYRMMQCQCIQSAYICIDEQCDCTLGLSMTGGVLVSTVPLNDQIHSLCVRYLLERLHFTVYSSPTQVQRH